jgi:dTDP-4-dehydrorhamnose reductase
MKAAIIGANGQLGVDLCRVLAAQKISVLPLTHRDIDVSDSGHVERVLSSIQADVVISTAAFHKVEECEKQPTQSFAVNAVGPRNLALACRRKNAVLVHFSTDYVFDGAQSRPYTESDLPRPLNVYGVSKLAGEHMLRLTWERHFVVRTCGLYGVAGSAGKGGNFVETRLKKANEGMPIRVVDDQVLTPTFTGDLAEAVSQLLRTEAYGLYHVSAEGECSWYEFARKIFELEELTVDLRPVSTREFPSPVQRPAYSVLSKQKLNHLGLGMPRWEGGLSRYSAVRRQTTVDIGAENRPA